MANTDILRKLRLALVAIANTDATLRTILGRAGENPPRALLVTWDNLRLDGPMGVVAYQLVGFSQTGADNDTREGTVRCSAFADGSGALEIAESAIERIGQILTSPAMLAQGVDAAVLAATRDYEPAESDDPDSTDPEPTRRLVRADVALRVSISQAAA